MMKWGSSVIVILMLSACSTVPKYIAPDYGSIQSPPEDVGPAVRIAQQISTSYADLQHDAARGSSGWLSLPTILAAAGGAAVLLANPSNAGEVLGYIGIGAAAYETGRSSFVPRGTAMLYANGLGAIECVIGEAQMFYGNGVNPNSNLEVLRINRDMLAVSVDAASALEREALAESTNKEQEAAAKERQAAQDARKEMSDELVNARKLLTSANTEVDAAGVAGPVFRSAISAIQLRVITKGQEGRGVSYESLLTQYKVAQPAAATPQSADGVRTLAAQQADFRDAADSLRSAMQDVNGSMRPYSAALDRVRACPNAI